MIYLIFIDVFCDYIVCTFIVFISYINPCTRIIFAIQILKKNVIFIITFMHLCTSNKKNEKNFITIFSI